MDSDNILKRVRGEETKKGRISLYFDKQLWKEFQKEIQGLSASRVMEELVKDFIESSRIKKTHTETTVYHEGGKRLLEVSTTTKVAPAGEKLTIRPREQPKHLTAAEHDPIHIKKKGK